MLDLVGYTADKDLGKTSILEPSCGEGEFVIEIVRRLQESSRRFDFDFEEAFIGNVFAYDIDEATISSCLGRLADFGSSIPFGRNIRQADFLTASIALSMSLLGILPTFVTNRYPLNFFQTISSSSILSITGQTSTSCFLRRL